MNSPTTIRMKAALEQEYNDLTASVIEKSLNELNKANKKTETEKKSISKRLAELYNYGLFEQNSDEFQYLINNAVGFSPMSQEAFFQVKEIAKAMEQLLKSENQFGGKINESSVKQAKTILYKKIEQVLSDAVRKEAPMFYKIVYGLKEWLGLVQRNKLVTAAQALENTTSGYTARAYTKIGNAFSSMDTKELNKIRSNAGRNIYTDVVKNGALDFGDTNSPFLTRSRVLDFLTQASKNQIYQTTVAAATGRAFLEAMDSMHKVNLTHKFFVRNVIKTMMMKGMTKEDALKEASERLSGQSFEDAKVTAQEIIDKVNSAAGKELLPNNKQSVNRIAMDVVREALIHGQRITIKEIEAAYNAAYYAAGYELGHEANNLFSMGLAKMTASLSQISKKAIKEKDWGKATAATAANIVFSNILNPFVGGGTNWLVLAAQKAGIPTFNTAYRNLDALYDFAKRPKIDISTPEGLSKLQEKLRKDNLRQQTNIRLFLGAALSISLYAAFKASGGDDDLAEWEKKNPWAKKYLRKIYHPAIQFAMVQHDKEMLKMFQDMAGVKTDALDQGVKAIRALGNILSKDKKRNVKGYSELGNIFGDYFDTPLVPYRMVGEARNIYRGLQGLPELKYNRSEGKSFLEGFMKGGMLENTGVIETKPEKDKNKPYWKK